MEHISLRLHVHVLFKTLKIQMKRMNLKWHADPLNFKMDLIQFSRNIPTSGVVLKVRINQKASQCLSFKYVAYSYWYSRLKGLWEFAPFRRWLKISQRAIFKLFSICIWIAIETFCLLRPRWGTTHQNTDKDYGHLFRSVSESFFFDSDLSGYASPSDLNMSRKLFKTT